MNDFKILLYFNLPTIVQVGTIYKADLHKYNIISFDDPKSVLHPKNYNINTLL